MTKPALLGTLRIDEAEIANSITHGVGLLLSIAGSFVLIAASVAYGDLWRIVGCSIFAFTLVAVYTASTLSHVFANAPLRRIFRILDQGFIYLLIAGTYTPFGLAYLRGDWWWLLATMWAVALFGFISKVFFSHRVEAVAIWSYVILGWLPVLSAPKMMSLVPGIALGWMLVGGACYTLGTLFLIYDHKHNHFHAVWHLFVIGGSTCHFFAILFFVANGF